MMNIRSDAILQRFPEYRDKIVKQIEENEDFKCLCYDYGQCIQMLEPLISQTGQVSSALEEYLEIKIELEREVIKFLFE